MSPATTEAPADASPAAMDLPMPEPVPVTPATDPSIFTGTCEIDSLISKGGHLVIHRVAYALAVVLGVTAFVVRAISQIAARIGTIMYGPFRR
jgi:hypothetical protein